MQDFTALFDWRDPANKMSAEELVAALTARGMRNLKIPSHLVEALAWFRSRKRESRLRAVLKFKQKRKRLLEAMRLPASIEEPPKKAILYVYKKPRIRNERHRIRKGTQLVFPFAKRRPRWVQLHLPFKAIEIDDINDGKAVAPEARTEACVEPAPQTPQPCPQEPQEEPLVREEVPLPPPPPKPPSRTRQRALQNGGRKKICEVCADISDRRPKGEAGCPGCGLPYAEETIEVAASGSSGWSIEELAIGRL